ncbi:hypothetical protein LOAG_04413, partial [Loa loa]
MRETNEKRVNEVVVASLLKRRTSQIHTQTDTHTRRHIHTHIHTHTPVAISSANSLEHSTLIVQIQVTNPVERKEDANLWDFRTCNKE